METKKTLAAKTLILESINNELSLAGLRNEASASIKPVLEGLDKQRKENREKAEATLKGFDVIEAVKLCNATLPQGTGDDASRKRAQRARTWVIQRLTAVFTDYDFANKSEKIGKTSSNTIVFVKVGDNFVREARELMASVARVVKLLGKNEPSVETLAAALKAEVNPVETVLTAHEQEQARKLADIRLSSAVASLMALGMDAKTAEATARQAVVSK